MQDLRDKGFGLPTSPTQGLSGAPPNVESSANLTQALVWVEEDLELLGELVAIFLQDCPKRLVDLQDAMWASDAKRVQRVAHSIKGAVSGFGANRAKQLSQQLELMGMNSDLGKAQKVFQDLEAELQRVLAELGKPEWGPGPS